MKSETHLAWVRENGAVMARETVDANSGSLHSSKYASPNGTETWARVSDCRSKPMAEAKLSGEYCTAADRRASDARATLNDDPETGESYCPCQIHRVRDSPCLDQPRSETVAAVSLACLHTDNPLGSSNQTGDALSRGKTKKERRLAWRKVYPDEHVRCCRVDGHDRGQ